MIVALFRIADEHHVVFTTDFSFWHYAKPVVQTMWLVDTLGM